MLSDASSGMSLCYYYTCNSASDNCKFFSMFNSKQPLSYKTINAFSEHRKEAFFIVDPPHLSKTIRNSFARGKFWVCNLIFNSSYDVKVNLSLSVQVIKLTGT